MVETKKIDWNNISNKKITELEGKLLDIQLNRNIIEVENIYRIFNEWNNLIYKGGMKNGKRDGKGLEYCPHTGQILYDGNFKEGYYMDMVNYILNQVMRVLQKMNHHIGRDYLKKVYIMD